MEIKPVLPKRKNITRRKIQPKKKSKERYVKKESREKAWFETKVSQEADTLRGPEYQYLKNKDDKEWKRK